MKFRTEQKSMPEIIIIPMIDIMFFLLVFFMLSTMYMTNLKAVPVKISDMGSGTTINESVLPMSIDAEGNIFLGDIKTQKKELEKSLQTIVQKNGDVKILLRVDKASSFENFAFVTQSLKQAGVRQIIMATEKGQ
ncbi:MAG: biopolymer transporter ExbD [Phascolarctobacterium sp.]|nr:biopolymer transporter ExbD [Phascolarctobacterium sp.]